ncbi:MAG TPA: molybdopterin cofactor-binding domain-containing protein, partial [Vicinamibacterales bacterium]|nr:molybdopterin cofactor-binding domain-containing protein [Vicinamibacterales bacterium]
MTGRPATPKLVALGPSDGGPASPELVTSRPSEGGTRREFLKGSGALVVCFSASALEPFALAQGRGGAAQRSSVDARLLDSWIGIAADGSVTAHTGKCELGQGIQTAQTQLIAEEL